MPRAIRNEERQWRLWYVAGMPAEICGGNELMDAEQVITTIIEEWPGQREAMRKAMLGPDLKIRRGDSYKGQRFVAACVA